MNSNDDTEKHMQHTPAHLTDDEILELNELCSFVADDRLTDAQRARLSSWLRESAAAREYYVRSMALNASLHTYAAEIQTDPAQPQERVSRWRAPIIRLNAWWAGLGLVGAAAAITLLFMTLPRRAAAPSDNPQTTSAQNPQAPECVATITGLKDAQWQTPGQLFNPGDSVRQGQQLRLTSGTVEITFDSGASVTLDGPAVFDINSAWDATLRSGLIKANVPHEAIGFRISNAAVDVVDLGTEFTMNAANGTAEVHVLKGEVEASPRSNPPDQDTLVMRENESFRFANTGITPLDAADPILARLSQEMAIDRFQPDTRHYRVTFDAPVANETLNSIHPKISTTDSKNAQFAEGRFGRALRFDGTVYTQSKVPDLSSHATHTISFWVRVPRETNLAESYAMVAWSTSLPKLNLRPVHISWNRTPAEGTLGAIRTDFGGGCAIGTTSLRDGRWHHVAIVFAPGDENAPLQVKQYVDGHLESGSIIPGQTRSSVRVGEINAVLQDTLWLGCRIGATGPRKDRFRGEISEVHITERVLSPLEIVSLMRTNQFAVPATAVAGK